MYLRASEWARAHGIPYRQVRTAMQRLYKHRAHGRDHVVDGMVTIQGHEHEARVTWSGSQFTYWLWIEDKTMEHTFGAFSIHCERDTWTISGPEFVWILPDQLNDEAVAATIAHNLNDAYTTGRNDGAVWERTRYARDQLFVKTDKGKKRGTNKG